MEEDGSTTKRKDFKSNRREWDYYEKLGWHWYTRGGRTPSGNKWATGPCSDHTTGYVAPIISSVAIMPGHGAEGDLKTRGGDAVKVTGTNLGPTDNSNDDVFHFSGHADAVYDAALGAYYLVSAGSTDAGDNALP